jgi:hypothetical protein
LTGNRGILHNHRQEIVRPWKNKAWITCALAWGDVRRPLLSPGTWTELFFLDEATAFAAGHRPCAFCRRPRYNEFKAAWLAANPGYFPAGEPSIREIDSILHAERIQPGRRKVTFAALAATLPEGAMVEWEASALLKWQDGWRAWSFAGYRTAVHPPPAAATVQVLTPATVVNLFRAGFRPAVHASAGS